MSFRLAAAAAIAAMIAAPGAVSGQVLMERNVSVKMALKIAETALDECGTRVSVAIVDRAGRLRVFLQGDGAAPAARPTRRGRFAALRWNGPSAPPRAGLWASACWRM